jgi:hypothetical protein
MVERRPPSAAMGPLHCPLCIGLALLSMLRTAAYGMLLARMAGFGARAVGELPPPLPSPLPAPLLAH